MFAIYSQPAPAFQQSLFQTYSASHVSPLAPRDPNAFSSVPTAYPHSSKMTDSFSSMPLPSISTSRPNLQGRRPTHIRASKYATLTEGKDKEAQREKRRREYLDKVKEDREEKRFEARGEQGLRREWIEERKAWWEEREKEGEEWVDEVDEEEATGDDEIDEVERIAMEDRMLNEMAMEAEDMEQDQYQERDMTEYGSDDEDYENLMMDIAAQAETRAETEFASSARDYSQGMDMS